MACSLAIPSVASTPLSPLPTAAEKDWPWQLRTAPPVSAQIFRSESIVRRSCCAIARAVSEGQLRLIRTRPYSRSGWSNGKLNINSGLRRQRIPPLIGQVRIVLHSGKSGDEDTSQIFGRRRMPCWPSARTKVPVKTSLIYWIPYGKLPIQFRQTENIGWCN